MHKLQYLIFFLAITCEQAIAQTLPQEGSDLNYRLIGFSFPNAKNKDNYVLEIAKGNYSSRDSFRKNIIKAYTCNSNKVIGEVPSFGEQYTWRIINKDTKLPMGEMHHFSTAYITEVDTSKVRLNILKHAERYKDAYVLPDNNKVLYDMKGQPIWFLPDKAGRADVVSNLQITPFGTITFLLADRAYEVNYNGDVLWQGPNNGEVSGDSVEHYHHDFARLANGHYMVLGNEPVALHRKLFNSDTFLHVDDSVLNQKSLFGTVIEYDEKGKVVWHWKSYEYYLHSDLINYNPVYPDVPETIDLHENAFYFDENKKVVYVGFKNISRIIKIKYPEGNVIAGYGEVYKRGEKPKGNGLFCGQHSISAGEENNLYVFNNNTCKPGETPTLLCIKEQEKAKMGIQKTWEYICTVETKEKKKLNRGGNIEVLPDKCLFACLGGAYSKIFIIDSDKDILWSALPEKWNAMEMKWEAIAQYRASIVMDKNELEKTIWNIMK